MNVGLRVNIYKITHLLSIQHSSLIKSRTSNRKTLNNIIIFMSSNQSYNDIYTHLTLKNNYSFFNKKVFFFLAS